MAHVSAKRLKGEVMRVEVFTTQLLSFRLVAPSNIQVGPDPAGSDVAVSLLVERFDIESYSDFSAK